MIITFAVPCFGLHGPHVVGHCGPIHLLRVICVKGNDEQRDSKQGQTGQLEYKNKVERSLKMTVNVREAWRGPNTTIERTQKQQRPHSDDPVQLVSEL